ncbi:ACBP-domain-containing protein [Punctularia strigosozonata HHB-11173 SS5]|uniref:ACBP-domain-containing protein n=1 Tax=Punctularia strigosozonata (strain HHB-11173) TaxID=741275 RepID=UPI000441836A|nr:ACBP-domain-containing protein [Punctularia strigosozonata HHB-11173 SS5]EIN10465.1 ACBP-domain-containing protein [Punctularia strigosozonata HHB-11173 SS5]
MDSRELIDAQFDRAVEIVQGLPKTGPIQTGYEEKLTMYSLYKQATVGNVKGPRPAMWDMLGRAKWDAWAKHKDLDTYEAKWLYVDALLKVLRRYSDKTVAKDIVRELEAFGGDPSNLVLSGSLSRSPGSESSGSTVSDDEPSSSRPVSLANPQALQGLRTLGNSSGEHPLEETTSEEETDDEIPAPLQPPSHDIRYSNFQRPQSSLSSHRYRTPLAGSMAMSPPPPAVQPHPGFETPSAFPGPSSPTVSGYPAPTTFSGPQAVSYQPNLYRPAQASPRPYVPQVPQRMPLERAIENMQAHLAALTERIELMELTSGVAQRSRSSLAASRTPSSPKTPGEGSGEGEWYSDLGMWTHVLRPLAQCIERLREFLLNQQPENRSPAFFVIRRLFLDISFLMCLLMVVKGLWRATGVRRREVQRALVILWRAVVGSNVKSPRVMTERGV